jgi:hypothetical protein
MTESPSSDYGHRVRSANLRRLLAAIWSDPLGRRWLLLSQAALVGQVVFDLAIPLAIRQIVNNASSPATSTR